MYFAVKKVINSNPEALERQYVEDYVELNSDPQYADLIKEEKKTGRAYAICTILILPAFVAALVLSVSRLYSVGAPEPVCLFCPPTPQQKEGDGTEKGRCFLQPRSFRI